MIALGPVPVLALDMAPSGVIFVTLLPVTPENPMYKFPDESLVISDGDSTKVVRIIETPVVGVILLIFFDV